MRNTQDYTGAIPVFARVIHPFQCVLFQDHSSTIPVPTCSSISAPFEDHCTIPGLDHSCTAVPFQDHSSTWTVQNLEIQSTTQDRSGIWVRFQVHSSTWSSVHLEYDSIQVLEVPSRTIPLPAKPSWTGWQGHTSIPVSTSPGPFQYHSSTHLQFCLKTIQNHSGNLSTSAWSTFPRTTPLAECHSRTIQSTTQGHSGSWVRL